MSNKNEISINLPSLDQQHFLVLKSDTEQAISILKENLNAKRFSKTDGVNYSSIDPRIFNTIEQGWVPPTSDIIEAWFTQVKTLFNEYGSDGKLAVLLGLQGRGADRRIRAYRNGDEIIPYGVWRTFLELTGRAVVDVKPVLGIFDSE